MNSANLLSLPQEIFLEVIQYLPLKSIHTLGAVCRDLHLKIHQNEHFWLRKVRQELKLITIDPDYSGQICSEYWKFIPNGVIQDPMIQGAKETYLLYSKEFQTNQKRKMSEKSTTSIPYVKTFLSMIPLNKQNQNRTSKLALLGPGIESPRTKHLVHKLVNAHDDLLNVFGMVPSTTSGGFGSAILIDFKKLFSFELTCLYSNSQRIREQHNLEQNSNTRLLASHNRLLAKDVNFSEKGPWLSDNIIKLLTTLDGILFAIDAQETESVQNELKLLLQSLDDICSPMPVLILCCVTSDSNDIDLRIHSENLNLLKIKRSWGLFKINISTMEGMDSALTWILYHNQKQKEELRFHEKSANS